MARSAEDIANSCFRKIGVKQKITSFDEGTPAANFASDRYPELRDELLRSHPWNFAIETVKLAQLTSTPVVEFDREYSLPDDWVRTIGVYDNDAGSGSIPYREEAGKIRVSREEVWMRYVREITDPNDMTPDFREALAYALAIEAAIDLVGSRSLSERMEQRFEKKILKAKSTDAQSDGPRELPRGSWVTNRTTRSPMVIST